MNKYGIFLLFTVSTTTFGQKCLESKFLIYNKGVLDFQSFKKYDAKGNLINQTDAKIGSFTTEFTYQYDVKGNNTQVVTRQNGQFRNVTLKQYSAQGKLIAETLSNDENAKSINQNIAFTNNVSEKTIAGQKGKERSTFDDNGNLIKHEVLDENGAIKSSVTNELNSAGKPLKTTNYNAFDKLTTEVIYEYDSKGNILKDKMLRNGNLYNQTTFEYNSANKLTKKTRLNAAGKVEYFYTYEYDSQGRLAKSSYYYNDQVVNYTSYIYDSQGNKTKEEYYNNENSLMGYKEWEYICK
jgi:hypothetical protein